MSIICDVEGQDQQCVGQLELKVHSIWDTYRLDGVCRTQQGHREVTQILGPDVPHTPRS